MPFVTARAYVTPPVGAAMDATLVDGPLGPTQFAHWSGLAVESWR
jgi:hypothetical protein